MWHGNVVRFLGGRNVIVKRLAVGIGAMYGPSDLHLVPPTVASAFQISLKLKHLRPGW